MGGGYVNTELRGITDPAIFKLIDYILFDDGELPLLRLLTDGELIRTLSFSPSISNEIIRSNIDSKENISFSETGVPDYDGLQNNHYINLIELTNPMHVHSAMVHWIIYIDMKPLPSN
jgi:hypothetical protein